MIRKLFGKAVLALIASAVMVTAAHAITTCADLKGRMSSAFVAAGHGPLEWELETTAIKNWRITNVSWVEIAVVCDESTDEVVTLDADLHRQSGATPRMQAIFEYAMLRAIDPQITPLQATELMARAHHTAMANSEDGVRGEHEFDHGAYRMRVRLNPIGPRYGWELLREMEKREREQEEYRRLHPEEFLDEEEEE